MDVRPPGPDPPSFLGPYPALADPLRCSGQPTSMSCRSAGDPLLSSAELGRARYAIAETSTCQWAPAPRPHLCAVHPQRPKTLIDNNFRAGPLRVAFFKPKPAPGCPSFRRTGRSSLAYHTELMGGDDASRTGKRCPSVRAFGSRCACTALFFSGNHGAAARPRVAVPAT